MKCPQCEIMYHNISDIEYIEEYGCCTRCYSGEDDIYEDDED